MVQNHNRHTSLIKNIEKNKKMCLLIVTNSWNKKY